MAMYMNSVIKSITVRSDILCVGPVNWFARAEVCLYCPHRDQSWSWNVIATSVRFSGVRGPSMDMWNMSGMKNFSLTERFKLQFRAEFLNAFNHTVLAAPNTTPTNSAFGSITAENVQPRFIHFGLRLIF